METDIIYKLGVRDMIANLFMGIRTNGLDSTLIELAKSIKDNPHAVWYLKENDR